MDVEEPIAEDQQPPPNADLAAPTADSPEPSSEEDGVVAPLTEPPPSGTEGGENAVEDVTEYVDAVTTPAAAVQVVGTVSETAATIVPDETAAASELTVVRQALSVCVVLVGGVSARCSQATHTAVS